MTGMAIRVEGAAVSRWIEGMEKLDYGTYSISYTMQL
jgi:hypothetical protein